MSENDGSAREQSTIGGCVPDAQRPRLPSPSAQWNSCRSFLREQWKTAKDQQVVRERKKDRKVRNNAERTADLASRRPPPGVLRALTWNVWMDHRCSLDPPPP